jgi:protein-L-isoaspartate(D-aspartate) O-methyltransferase
MASIAMAETDNGPQDRERVFARARERLVEELRFQGIRDERVLEVIHKVPRHEFVLEEYKPYAYENRPLPIEDGQTISQPYIVAYMLERLELKPEDEVLEIGTGSGWQTALLAKLAAEVYTVERSAVLLEKAKRRLRAMGYQNVCFKLGNGTLGWPEHAPYDAIIGSGSVPRVPPSLKAQLADGGRLVLPVGERHFQKIVLVRRHGDEYIEHKFVDCSFLPLIGAEGWPETEPEEEAAGE